MKRSIVTLFVAGAFLMGRAQTTNTGIFYIGSGTPVTLGDLNNTGSFTNNGTTNITGNVTNSQVNMPAGTGTVVFSGTTGQTLGGTAPFRSLNITINNAAGLTLSNRLSIGDGSGGTLTFSAGHIVTGTNTQDVYFYPGSAYSGFSGASHVVGYVTKSGNANFSFPIGDGSHTAPIGLSNLSGSADFQALYSGAGYGSYGTSSPLAGGGVDEKEYWTLGPTTGSASARVTLYWDDTRKYLNHTSPATLVVAHFNSSVWQAVGGSSSNSAGSTTGQVGPSNTLSSFSPFTFGSTSINLPITLASFTVKNQQCAAYLSWTTTLELNAATFDIQQSSDGTNFMTVASVPADDTASTYHLTLAQSTQHSFYRLRMVDKDGTATYSPIDGLALGCLPSANRLSLYPNPVPAGAQLQAKLTSPATQGTAQLQIYDAVGRRVYSTVVTVNTGVNTYSLPAGGLGQGLYSVVVIGDGWKTDVVTFTK